MDEFQRMMHLSGVKISAPLIDDKVETVVEEKVVVKEEVTVSSVMKKHKMLKEDVMDRLKTGTFKVMEHIDDVNKAEIIALQKIYENPEHFSGQDFENKITYQEMSQQLDHTLETITPAEFHTIIENIMSCVDFEDIDNYAKLGKYVVDIVKQRSSTKM